MAGHEALVALIVKETHECRLRVPWLTEDIFMSITQTCIGPLQCVFNAYKTRDRAFDSKNQDEITKATRAVQDATDTLVTALSKVTLFPHGLATIYMCLDQTNVII